MSEATFTDATYRGMTEADGSTRLVVVERPQGGSSELAHDGRFADRVGWGWGGPPALELARALLQDAVDEAAAERLVDELREVVARLDGSWAISASWLRAWATAHAVGWLGAWATAKDVAGLEGHRP